MGMDWPQAGEQKEPRQRIPEGCVTNFVFLEKNDFFLVRITI